MSEFTEWLMININGMPLVIAYAIFILSSSFSLMLVCVGISYLRSTQYYRYDSADFDEEEENKE